MYSPPQLSITFEAALRDLLSRSAHTRSQAALALGDVQGAEDQARAVDALIETLADGHPGVRSAAASSLGELGGPKAVLALIEATGDETSGTRQAAVIALGATGDARAFEPLAKLLADGAPDLRFQAATSLAEVDPDRAPPHLVKALADDDEQVVSAAALALGACGDSRHAPALVALLDEKSHVFDLAYGLARLGDDAAVDHLEVFLGHKEHAWDAIEAMEMTGSMRAISPLLAVVKSRSARPHRIRAAAAALALGSHDREAREELLSATRAWKHHLRALAVEHLGRVGGVWARAALLELSNARRGRLLREEIGEALARLPEQERPTA